MVPGKVAESVIDNTLICLGEFSSRTERRIGMIGHGQSKALRPDRFNPAERRRYQILRLSRSPKNFCASISALPHCPDHALPANSRIRQKHFGAFTCLTIDRIFRLIPGWRRGAKLINVVPTSGRNESRSDTMILFPDKFAQPRSGRVTVVRRGAMAALLIGGAVALTGAAEPQGQGQLRIVVNNVNGDKGRVEVAICTEQEFLKTCAHVASSPATLGTTIVMVRDLKPGIYAAQAYYDKNNNQKIDRGLFGIPREGVGFSNDAPIRMSPPKWSEARFSYNGHPSSITFKLRYF